METPEPRPYPEPKERELTDAEKQGIRECLQRGESSVYVLAKQFDCSPSQVAGIKAAMTKAGEGPIDDDSDHDTDTIITCALRFDGYAFAERCDDREILAKLLDQFVDTFETSSNPNMNHAAFFALQRYLYKWGGELLPESSREHLAFRLLYLHLYQLDVEPSLRIEEYWQRWREVCPDQAEQCAARIRRRLVRRNEAGLGG